jgi:hypothetical protein
LAKFKGKDRAEALRARVNAYVQEHSEHLCPLAERRLRDLDELVGEHPQSPSPPRSLRASCSAIERIAPREAL